MKNVWTLALLLTLPAASFGREARGRTAPKGGVFSGGRLTGGAPVQAAKARLSEPPAPQDETPPPWATPGALIRTEGLGFKHEPARAARIHLVEAGDRVVMEESRSQALTNRPGVFLGPKDTPPPHSPGPGGSSGGASGRSAVTPNAPGGGSR